MTMQSVKSVYFAGMLLFAAVLFGAGVVRGPRSLPATGPRETAILAGGCFWGMEETLRKLPGVVETTVGFTGGTTLNPTYETVATRLTGHAEAVKVVFDPQRMSYEKLLDYFFRMHLPATRDSRPTSAGLPSRSAIFWFGEEQRQTAERVKALWEGPGKFGRPIATEIATATPFYPAAEYHQKYYLKNGGGNGPVCHQLRD